MNNNEDTRERVPATLDHWEPFAPPRQWWGVFHVEAPDADAIALLPSKELAERFIASMERDPEHDDYLANPNYCHALAVRFCLNASYAPAIRAEFWNSFEAPPQTTEQS